jgi:hypothetical protein
MDNNLSWMNVSAHWADNASVKCGVNNSVFQKIFEQENSNIIADHCNYHIVHNCKTCFESNVVWYWKCSSKNTCRIFEFC